MPTDDQTLSVLTDLGHQVSRLMARVEQLEAENAELKAENTELRELGHFLKIKYPSNRSNQNIPLWQRGMAL